jgi:hypothetical protein
MSAAEELLPRVLARLSAERDLWNWRHVLAPLRSAARPETTRKALFCDLMTMRATAKVEALMAGLLRLKGYRPVVLLENPSRVIEEIFRAAAPDIEFEYLMGAPGTDRDGSRQAAEAVLARYPDANDLVAYEADGFRIGRNVLSLVLRQLRIGRLDPADAGHRSLVLEVLGRSLDAKRFVARVLDRHRPSVAVFNERGYTPAGEIFDACLLRDVDTIQWCAAPQSDCLIYRRYRTESRGDHPLGVSDALWSRLQEMAWTANEERAVVDRIAAGYATGEWYGRQKLQDGKAVMQPDEVRKALGLDPSKKTAVIFCHILYDATFFYGENLFEDYERWLIETVRAAIANPRLNWVIKVHPVNVWRSKMDGATQVQLEAESLQRNLGTLPEHVKLMRADTGIHTFSLFGITDYGLTVRGTVGMELPCFGVPVVTAGSGRYSGKGFTIDPATREGYLALLARLEEVPRLDAAAIRRARLNYYGAVDLKPAPMRSFILDFLASTDAAGRSVPDVFLTRRADPSLLETKDLGRLIRWLTTSNAPELLAREI